MERFLWVCLAGAAGTGVRYLITIWAARHLGVAFPYGTLIVNVAGCYLMGLVVESAAATWPPTLRAAVMAGFLGGMTTYSSFNAESTTLLRAGVADIAVANVVLTLVGCFAAGWLGILTARQLAP